MAVLKDCALYSRMPLHRRAYRIDRESNRLFNRLKHWSVLPLCLCQRTIIRSTDSAISL